MPSIGQYEYPAMNVATAIDAAKKVATQFKGQPFDRVPLAAALGYKTAGSGAFNQTLADLRRFGVVDGRGDSMQVSALAQKLAVPTSKEEYAGVVLELINRVPLFKALYEHYSGSAPSEEDLLATLINLTKAERTEVQGVVGRVRANFVSGLSALSAAGPIPRASAGQPGQRAGLVPGGDHRKASLGPLEGDPTDHVIEVVAGTIHIRFPMTETGIKLMRHNFEGKGFWEILEAEVAKAASVPFPSTTPEKTPPSTDAASKSKQ